jgi:hypothetical protein
MRIFLNEPPVEVYKAQEYLDIVNTLRLGPLGHHFYPSRVYAYTLPTHYKAQKLNLHLEK